MYILSRIELTKGREQTAEKPAPELQGDTFTIYQLKDGDTTRDLRFEPFDRLRAAPDLANYNNVYAATLGNDITLKDIYFTFNMDRPEDFKGHSLSVSDIVVMNTGGRETAFYVDSMGFKELPDLQTRKSRHRKSPPRRLT